MNNKNDFIDDFKPSLPTSYRYMAKISFQYNNYCDENHNYSRQDGKHTKNVCKKAPHPNSCKASADDSAVTRRNTCINSIHGKNLSPKFNSTTSCNSNINTTQPTTPMKDGKFCAFTTKFASKCKHAINYISLTYHLKFTEILSLLCAILRGNPFTPCPHCKASMKDSVNQSSLLMIDAIHKPLVRKWLHDNLKDTGSYLLKDVLFPKIYAFISNLCFNNSKPILPNPKSNTFNCINIDDTLHTIDDAHTRSDSSVVSTQNRHPADEKRLNHTYAEICKRGTANCANKHKIMKGNKNQTQLCKDDNDNPFQSHTSNMDDNTNSNCNTSHAKECHLVNNTTNTHKQPDDITRIQTNDHTPSLKTTMRDSNLNMRDSNLNALHPASEGSSVVKSSPNEGKFCVKDNKGKTKLKQREISNLSSVINHSYLKDSIPNFNSSSSSNSCENSQQVKQHTFADAKKKNNFLNTVMNNAKKVINSNANREQHVKNQHTKHSSNRNRENDNIPTIVTRFDTNVNTHTFTSKNPTNSSVKSHPFCKESSSKTFNTKQNGNSDQHTFTDSKQSLVKQIPAKTKQIMVNVHENNTRKETHPQSEESSNSMDHHMKDEETHSSLQSICKSSTNRASNSRLSDFNVEGTGDSSLRRKMKQKKRKKKKSNTNEVKITYDENSITPTSQDQFLFDTLHSYYNDWSQVYQPQECNLSTDKIQTNPSSLSIDVDNAGYSENNSDNHVEADPDDVDNDHNITTSESPANSTPPVFVSESHTCAHDISKELHKTAKIPNIPLIDVFFQDAKASKCIPISSLMDTGSETCLMAPRLARRLGLKILPNNTGKKWYDVNGNEIDCLGMVNCQLCIENIWIHKQIPVLEQPSHNFIIGTDLLAESRHMYPICLREKYRDLGKRRASGCIGK